MRLWPVMLGVAALLAVHAAVVLGGVYLMLGAFGDELDRELDAQVERVREDFRTDLDGIREQVRDDLRRELDERLPLP
jgi:hypothetical protein